MSHMCDGRDPSCGRCRTIARRHDSVRIAMSLGDQLDDIKQAQIWSRIQDRLAAPAPPLRRRVAVAMVAAVAAGVVIAVAMTRGGGGPSRTFVAPSETTLSVRIGDTQASLLGPAQLDVVEATPTVTSLDLREGTLLAEFEGGHGRLRISAPGATIEIVGTLFAIAVHGRGTCVSVAHGTVRMTTGTHTLSIGGGQRACSDDGVPQAIDPATHEALARHAAVLTASRAAAGSAAAEAPPTPPVAAAVAAGPSTASPTTEVPPAAPATIAAEADRATAASSAPPATAALPPAGQATAALPPAGQAKTVLPPAGQATASSSGSPATPVRGPRATAAHPQITPPSSAPSTPGPAPLPRANTSPLARSAVASTPALVPVDPRPASVVPAPAPAATASSLYLEAEAALAKRDLATADQRLAALVAQFPESALLDQVLYERARIAYRRHAWADAQRQLDRLSTIQASPLREPGAYLACRVAFDASDRGAAACLIGYQSRYPQSPHAADVMGLLAEIGFATGGCPAVQLQLAELIQSHPGAAVTRDWQRRCPGAR